MFYNLEPCLLPTNKTKRHRQEGTASFQCAKCKHSTFQSSQIWRALSLFGEHLQESSVLRDLPPLLRGILSRERPLENSVWRHLLPLSREHLQESSAWNCLPLALGKTGLPLSQELRPSEVRSRDRLSEVRSRELHPTKVGLV